jgi:pimeloyl-ACP methyl ester carboxylesterase
MIPTFIFTIWLLGLLSVAIVGAAIYFGHEWYQRSWLWDETLRRSVFAPEFGWNEVTGYLAAALALVLIALFGSSILKAILRLSRPKGDDPRPGLPQPSVERRLERPDGTVLEVKIYGAADAPALVFSHGWGMNSDEWVYAERELAKDFRLVVWDEPGLGGSTRPKNRDFSLEKFANDLNAILDLVGAHSVILVGHSIGGMIALTFSRLFPGALGSRVAGLVLTHTTYTDPIRTTKGAAFLSALEKPVLLPLLYLTIAFSPLVWLMNWLAYRNGTAHLSTKRSSYAGTETWEQIDFAARFQIKASPAVLARGMLGMIRYDATETLKAIRVPTLIVSGDRDKTCKPSASSRMHHDIPGSRLVTLSPARHLGLLEHHLRYAQAVHDFARAELPGWSPPKTAA